jgi:tetratricopeptide (TPR) repeat protein
MELLTGETLADRLDRLGPLCPEEALPLCRQMADALEAAHRAGVIHRDFKSDNIFLVPDEHEPHGLRVVVTDFGLALGRAPGLQGRSRSLDGEFIGTPAYMAPEQIEGHALTPRTDLYAFGVVLYEMVTGGRPFAEKTPLATALKRLREPPPSPRELCPGLPRAWERAILRCLERDPQRRFAGALEVVDALSRDSSSTSARSLRGLRPAAAPWRRPAAITLAALLGLGLLFVGWKTLSPFLRIDMRPGRAARASARRTVAVLGFKNLSGRPEAAWLSTALQEMLSTELAAGEKLRLVPGENVARMKSDLELGDADSYGKDTLSRIRCHIGADLVVLGSYLALGQDAGGRLRLDLRLQDAVSGELLGAINLAGTESELLDLVSQASGHLRGKLGLTRLSERDQEVVNASLPKHPAAEQLYAEGLARLHRFDAIGAEERLARAVALEPEHPLLHAALSEAFGQLGHTAREQEEAQQALKLSSHLLREGKLLVEARYRTAMREWDQASRIYRALFDFFPDDLEYGLALARAMIAGGHASEAFKLVEQLRKLPPPAQGDPRIDEAEANAALKLPDYPRAQAAALRAATQAEANGQRLLAGRARMDEALAQFYRGDHAQAMVTLRTAQRLQIAAGDTLGVALNLHLFSAQLMFQGELAQAQRVLQEAVTLYLRIGNRHMAMRGLTMSGYQLMALGRPVEARAQLAQAEALAQASGDPRNLLFVESERAFVEIFQLAGEPRRARQQLEQMLWAQHDKATSQDLYGPRTSLATILVAQGDLDAGRKLLQEQLQQNQESGGAEGISFIHMALGELEFAADRTTEAERLARQSLDEMGRIGNLRPREAWTRAVLAEALVTQGKAAEARQGVAQVLILTEHMENLYFRLHALLHVARVQLALGQVSDLRQARELLTALLGEARRSSLVGEALEARHLLARVAEKEGHAAAARTELQAVAREADARGYSLLARQARQSLR